jgi:serine/threonine protein phosphatase 1
MTGRLIAVGDIHGCPHEFEELLRQINPVAGDRVVILGDLVNRGPDSPAVLALARAVGALALLGNHEARLLRYRSSGDRKMLKDGDLQTAEALGPADWAYLESMRLTYEEPDLNTVFVHGGFLPSEPWQRQGAEVVTRIQVIDKDGRPRKRAESPDSPAWADLWSGPPFVVYGHTPRPEIYKLKWSMGIDTGCVIGGALSAYILPERRVIQVKARQRYFS